jgi:hypothetical protein
MATLLVRHGGTCNCITLLPRNGHLHLQVLTVPSDCPTGSLLYTLDIEYDLCRGYSVDYSSRVTVVSHSKSVAVPARTEMRLGMLMASHLLRKTGIAEPIPLLSNPPSKTKAMLVCKVLVPGAQKVTISVHITGNLMLTPIIQQSQPKCVLISLSTFPPQESRLLMWHYSHEPLYCIVSVPKGLQTLFQIFIGYGVRPPFALYDLQC